MNAKTIDAALIAGGQTNVFVNTAVITSVQLANGFIATSGDTNGVAIKQACGWIADGIAQTANNYVVGLKKKAHK